MSEIRKEIEMKQVYESHSKLFENLSLLDNWDQKQFFYLRKNDRDRTISPVDRGNMSQLSDSEVCLNFVADAFFELRDHYREKINSGVKPFMGMQTLVAEKAYVRPIASFLDHQKRLEALFMQEFGKPGSDKIETFDDFMFQFDRFLDRYAHRYPILYSTFVNSHYCSLYSTGAMIELGSHGHDNDSTRLDAILDDSFGFYADLAKEYGFTVPRHAPWCLVANLDSQAMMNYAIQYDALTKKQVMKEYFYECKDHDIDLLKSLIFNTLQALSEQAPSIKKTSICKKGRLRVRNVKRALLATKKLFNESFSSEDLLRKYIEILVRERKIKIEKPKLDLLFGECYYMFEKQGFDASYTYIEMKILETKKDRIR